MSDLAEKSKQPMGLRLAAAKKAGLNMNEVCVLMLACSKPEGYRKKDICRILNLSEGAVRGFVNRLIHKGQLYVNHKGHNQFYIKGTREGMDTSYFIDGTLSRRTNK